MRKRRWTHTFFSGALPVAALLLSTSASAEGPAPTPPAPAPVCEPTAAMLVPKYPPEAKECYEYAGSVVSINWGTVDASKYGLTDPKPEDPRLDLPTTVHDLRSHSVVKDGITVCSVTVSHEWVRVEPCGDPAEARKKAEASVPRPKPKVKVPNAPIQQSRLTGQGIQQLALAAKINAGAQLAHLHPLFDSFLAQPRGPQPNMPAQRANARPLVYRYAAVTLGTPPLPNPAAPPAPNNPAPTQVDPTRGATPATPGATPVNPGKRRNQAPAQ